jgi:hypothetical protein
MRSMDDNRKRFLIHQNNQMNRTRRAVTMPAAPPSPVNTPSGTSSIASSAAAVASAAMNIFSGSRFTSSSRESRVTFAAKSQTISEPVESSDRHDGDESSHQSGSVGYETASTDGRSGGWSSRDRQGSVGSGGMASLLGAWLGYTSNKQDEEDTTPEAYVNRLLKRWVNYNLSWIFSNRILLTVVTHHEHLSSIYCH